MFARHKFRRLESKYLKKLEEARDLQRGADIQGFAVATREASDIARRIDELKAAVSKAPTTPEL